jgi:hypothetical protein
MVRNSGIPKSQRGGECSCDSPRKTSLQSRSGAVPGATEETPAGLGLCVTCEAAETCALPRPEGGIWHCEFYR